MRIMIYSTMFIFIQGCVIISLATAMVDDQPYCHLRYKRLCQGKGRHIACQFPDPGPGPSCENYTVIKFSNDLKHFILHYVNRRRQRIATGNERVRGGLHLPKPEVMMMVEWDRELAFLAQRLADQCHFVHDDCRATVRYPYAGQTVGEVRWRRSEEPIELGARRSIRRVFDAWWGERRRVTPQQITAPFRLTAKGAVWGHFTQLAVWTLQAMGCGAVHHGTSHPRLLLVCDFSHTNMLGQRTLSPGTLSPCPIHFVRRARSQYPLLCAPVRHPITVETDDETYPDEEDEDEDLLQDHSFTEDVVEVSTKASVVHRTRTTPVEDLPVPVSKSKEHPNFRHKGVLIEKLDKELENKNGKDENPRQQWPAKSFQDKVRMKAKSKIANLRDEYEMPQSHVHNLPYTRLQTHVRLWNNHEEIEIPIERSREKIEIPIERSRETQHPTIDIFRPRETTQDFAPIRHRWKQTRDRPRRPGESALLFTSSVAIVNQKRISVAPLMLDKDDVEQLFRDTGFKIRQK